LIPLVYFYYFIILGHAAFKKMRQAGALVTDIIIIVIAADEGVQQQTIEAIEISKNANVPIIIALNKIDKISKNFDINKQLMQHDLYTEE
jgi:translation initiation factor IF-2